MYVISDDILERLLCSVCKKYLSVKPVKVYPNRGIKCGRCSSQDDAGLVSLFDLIAKEGLFRCINRYEGCDKLLASTEVVEHEKICKGGCYDCPLCVDFHGSAYEVLYHYKTLHENKFLKAPEVWVQLENEFYDVYLYKKNDFLFFVNVKFSISEDELTVMIEYIGAKDISKKIEHSMSIHSLEGPKTKSRKKMCSSVAEQDPKMFKFILKLDDFPKNIAICKFCLNTEAVENLLAVPERSLTFSFGSNSLKNEGSSTIKAEADATNPTPLPTPPVFVQKGFSYTPSTLFGATATTNTTTSTTFGAAVTTTFSTSASSSSLVCPVKSEPLSAPVVNTMPGFKFPVYYHPAAPNSPVRPATFNPNGRPPVTKNGTVHTSSKPIFSPNFSSQGRYSNK